MRHLDGWSVEALLAEAGRAIDESIAVLDSLGGVEVTAEAGNGSVIAVADGNGILTEVHVDRGSCHGANAERLAGQLLAAIRQVEWVAGHRRAERFGGISFAGEPMGQLLPQLHPPIAP